MTNPPKRQGRRRADQWSVRVDRVTTQLFPHQSKAPDIADDWKCECCKTVIVREVLPARRRAKKRGKR